MVYATGRAIGAPFKKMGLKALSDLSKVQRHGKLQGYQTQLYLNI